MTNDYPLVVKYSSIVLYCNTHNLQRHGQWAYYNIFPHFSICIVQLCIVQCGCILHTPDSLYFLDLNTSPHLSITGPYCWSDQCPHPTYLFVNVTCVRLRNLFRIPCDTWHTNQRKPRHSRQSMKSPSFNPPWFRGTDCILFCLTCY